MSRNETRTPAVEEAEIKQPDTFQSRKNLSRKNSGLDDSLILETDYYVRQMKQRRNKVKNFVVISTGLSHKKFWA
jgi:hypothetical protein